MEWKSLGGDFQANNNRQQLIIQQSTSAVTYLAKVLRLLDFIFGYIIIKLIHNTLLKDVNLSLCHIDKTKYEIKLTETGTQ